MNSNTSIIVLYRVEHLWYNGQTETSNEANINDPEAERWRWEFFIFILSQLCKNIWSATNFAKIYICYRGPRRQGHTVVAHGGRSCQEWALSVGQT
jgi:hypothetical protein